MPKKFFQTNCLGTLFKKKHVDDCSSSLKELNVFRKLYIDSVFPIDG